MLGSNSGQRAGSLQSAHTAAREPAVSSAQSKRHTGRRLRHGRGRLARGKLLGREARDARHGGADHRTRSS
jgi:hypothetical protein